MKNLNCDLCDKLVQCSKTGSSYTDKPLCAQGCVTAADQNQNRQQGNTATSTALAA